MYKKAGIVIAIILVVAGMVVLSISSCNKDGGIQVKPANDTEEVVSNSENANNENNEEESLSIKDENTGEDTSDDYVSELSYIDDSGVEHVDSNDDKSDSSIEADSNVVEQESSNTTLEPSNVTENSETASLSEEEQSALEELKEYKNKKESNIENSEQSEKESEQSSEISTDDSTGRLEYKEINEGDLPDKTQSKTVFGIITGKEMLIQGNSIFTAIVILDENSDTYRYFVPMSAYNNLDKGTKLEVSIMVYFDEGKSIKQVTGVSVAE